MLLKLHQLKCEPALLFQLGGAVQKCRGHVRSSRRVSGPGGAGGCGVSSPSPGAPALTLLCRVLISLWRSAASLFLAPIPNPSPVPGQQGGLMLQT